ncbi:(2Fe-2S)-binding protein [Halomonas sp. GXIMD04776]|uniref:(2Fe-2S)-binding protein n=1 Tax=Halomonas sp. GXIMD04776 TaxID=3415605 RepID=UPI003CAAFE4C
MFQRLDASSTPVRHVQIWLDGTPHQVPDTLTVAAAVLQLRGWQGYRRHVDGSLRAPLCMMGVCQECLITIDGRANRQGCLEPVAEGMRLERQGGGAHDA